MLWYGQKPQTIKSLMAERVCPQKLTVPSLLLGVFCLGFLNVKNSQETKKSLHFTHLGIIK